LGKGWGRVGEGLGKGWRRVGEGLGKGWGRVGSRVKQFAGFKPLISTPSTPQLLNSSTLNPSTLNPSTLNPSTQKLIILENPAS
jgi:hypothetical protein